MKTIREDGGVRGHILMEPSILPKFSQIQQCQAEIQSKGISSMNSTQNQRMTSQSTKFTSDSHFASTQMNFGQPPHESSDQRYEKILHCHRVKAIYLHKVLRLSKR